MRARAAGAAMVALAGCATVSGDPERGRLVFVERSQGHCVLCHAAPGIAVAGNVGPSLGGIGSRLSPEELRVRVTDITLVKPDAAMPTYGKSSGLERVSPAFAGRRILTGQQVDDVVAFLAGLK